MRSPELLTTGHDVLEMSREKGLMFETLDDRPIDGRRIWLDGQELAYFGSCSYLGLELDPRMKAAVREATERYGTQFSMSRGFLSAAPYGELEEGLSTMFGGHALITPTTTLGHVAAIPVLVREEDAVLMDFQVHASVQMATTLARAAGAHVELVRHNDAAVLEERVAALCQAHRKVWYLCDGVYSMFGDLPDVDHLRMLFDRHDQLHLYVDDAHGTGLAGQHGRGIHLARMGHHPRMVMAMSLNKSFAASGGCLVFPDATTREKVRLGSGPMIFSGPIQPPMLGAIKASLGIHLSDEIYPMQGELVRRVRLLNRLLLERDLPLLAENDTPIFFLKMGALQLSWALASRMRAHEGTYLPLATYPGVPIRRSGIRLTVTRHHTEEDLVRLADGLARQFPLALESEGFTRESIESRFFSIKRPRRKAASRDKGRGTPPAARPSPPVGAAAVQPEPELELTHARSIRELDAAEWDRLLGDRGSFAAEPLRLLEETFTGRAERENNWGFHYFIVRHEGTPIVATFATQALWKDDMLADAEVSKVIEERRRDDPYYLTSTVVALGSLLTEGDHLYVDRRGPWRQALRRLLDELETLVGRARASALVLRDLPANDPEMDEFFLANGLVKMPMLASYDLKLDGDEDDEAFLAGLLARHARLLRRDVLSVAHHFTVEVFGRDATRPTPAQLAHFRELFLRVRAGKLRLNTFDLPSDLLERACRAPGWEIIALTLDPAQGGRPDGMPVAMMLTSIGRERGVALLCGLDKEPRPINIYRQLLWQTVRHARVRGCSWLSLGVDTDVEKSRLGARRREQCVYVRSDDHFSAAVIDQLSQQLALEGRVRSELAAAG